MEKNRNSKMRAASANHWSSLSRRCSRRRARRGRFVARRQPGQSPEQTAALRKIAPWVTEHTANGKQAEFMVVLADQADLSGAAVLKTKKEKGRFVRDALWNKSQATQGPILKWLAAPRSRASLVLHRQRHLGKGPLR